MQYVYGSGKIVFVVLLRFVLTQQCFQINAMSMHDAQNDNGNMFNRTNVYHVHHLNLAR